MLSFESQIISVRHRMRWRDNHLIHKSNCLTYLTLGKAGVPCNSDYEKIKKTPTLYSQDEEM